jgi:Protein of unknown function (DUF1275)/Integrase core domain
MAVSRDADVTSGQQRRPVAESSNVASEINLLPPLTVLTVTTGVIDAVSFVGLGHVFTANMTGNVVFIGFALAGAQELSTGTLAILAQRLGTVWASPATWYHLVRRFGWRRFRLRVHSAKPKIGLRTTRANEMWHIDTTVIRLLDGRRAYLHAVIDNFSRRILAWRVAETFAPVNSVAVLVEASRAATPSETIRSCWRTRASRT